MSFFYLSISVFTWRTINIIIILIVDIIFDIKPHHRQQYNETKL